MSTGGIRCKEFEFGGNQRVALRFKTFAPKLQPDFTIETLLPESIFSQNQWYVSNSFMCLTQIL